MIPDVGYMGYMYRLESQCLKITEKVAFNIASDASYVYNLSGQKLIKNAKNSQFGEFLKILSLRSNSVTRQATLIGQTLGENTKIEKFKWDILGDFQTLCRLSYLYHDITIGVYQILWSLLKSNLNSKHDWDVKTPDNSDARYAIIIRVVVILRLF